MFVTNVDQRRVIHFFLIVYQFGSRESLDRINKGRKVFGFEHSLTNQISSATTTTSTSLNSDHLPLS